MEESIIQQEAEGLTLNKKSHRHNYKRVENYLICNCGKKILNLEEGEYEDLLVGKKQDGSRYSVRTDRRRYFFPNEWQSFISTVKNKKHKIFFLTCLHTGGRIMEVLNLRYRDIDMDRGTVTFSLVKQRKAKKNFYATGKTRAFFLASNFISEFKSFIRGAKINPEDYIFLDNDKLPKNYSKLENSDRKKYYSSKVVSYSNMLKRKLKKTEIKDWYNFSPHNIRKTYGMWMRTFHKEMAEICYRLGHDIDTYIAHYGSSLIFSDSDRIKIQKIFGEVR